ncbi:hypothetical protein [Clostridium estertheticum]|uniref:hypothetical protein n=1 Tax=Clostridium estertheticum TaxID=238834 RepID=UPI001C6EBF82|nr:hypothetical protein [Clostridium estertheticum]MBW9153866.1 hypothetical protein [Clostridium estertheticum]WLC86484.1 hypothetical protein KTC97_20315 [Clostridium estertheticum]
MYNRVSSLMSYRNNYNNILNTNKKTRNTNDINTTTTKYTSGNYAELKFNNNVLNVSSGTNYKIKTLMHGYADIYVKEGNNVGLLFYDMYPDKDVSEAFSEDEFNDMAQSTKLVKIIGGNHPLDEKLNLLRTFFPNCQEVRARLESLGAETGKMIQLDNNSEKVLLEPNGWLYTQEDLSNLRSAYTDKDFSQFGYTENSKFSIDGIDYKLDSTGHLNIPEGTICTPDRVKITK